MQIHMALDQLQCQHYSRILSPYLPLVPTHGMPAVLEGECGEI